MLFSESLSLESFQQNHQENKPSAVPLFSYHPVKLPDIMLQEPPKEISFAGYPVALAQDFSLSYIENQLYQSPYGKIAHQSGSHVEKYALPPYATLQNNSLQHAANILRSASICSYHSDLGASSIPVYFHGL